MLKGRTILPRAGAMGLEVSNRQSAASSRTPRAAHYGTAGHAGTGSRKVKQLEENQELRVLRESYRTMPFLEENGSSEEGWLLLSSAHPAKPVCSSSLW